MSKIIIKKKVKINDEIPKDNLKPIITIKKKPIININDDKESELEFNSKSNLELDLEPELESEEEKIIKLISLVFKSINEDIYNDIIDMHHIRKDVNIFNNVINKYDYTYFKSIIQNITSTNNNSEPDTLINVYSEFKCHAKTSNSKQCQQDKYNKTEFCKMHEHELPYGRIDEIINEKIVKKRSRPDIRSIVKKVNIIKNLDNDKYIDNDDKHENDSKSPINNDKTEIITGKKFIKNDKLYYIMNNLVYCNENNVDDADFILLINNNKIKCFGKYNPDNNTITF